MADEASRRRYLRWGSVALFVVFPGSIVGLTVSNFMQIADVKTRASRQGALLTRLEHRTTLEATEDHSAIYLSATSQTLAKAEIQQLVARMIDRVAGRLIEAQVPADSEPENEQQIVRVRATFDTTNKNLFELLYAIEMGVPLLVVEQISIRMLPSRSESHENDPVLRVSFSVRGQWKGSDE
jgi:hypothetical protein